MLTCSLPMNSRKRLARDVADSFANHADLVYDVTDTDCRAQNGSIHGCCWFVCFVVVVLFCFCLLLLFLWGFFFLGGGRGGCFLFLFFCDFKTSVLTRRTKTREKSCCVYTFYSIHIEKGARCFFVSIPL